MEHQKTNKEEIQDKICHAKTVEELLAISAEAGEALTLEDATKLLQELEAERAKAAEDFKSADDLSEEDLAKVAGGAQEHLFNKVTHNYHWTALANRVGANVVINFGSWDSRCTFWTCQNDWNREIVIKESVNRDIRTRYDECSVCGESPICRCCAHRSSQGIFNRDFCTCPEVLASTGL